MTDQGYQQRLSALEVANRVRIDGQQIKREIRSGRIRFDDALLDPRAQALRVVDLIGAQWGWGASKVTSAAMYLQIGVKVRVRDLTPARVERIGHEVAARHDEADRQRERRRKLAEQRVAA